MAPETLPSNKTRLKGQSPVLVRKIPYSLISALYIGLRVYPILSISEPKLYPDSRVYLSISKLPLLSNGFWTGKYPVTYPLLLKAIENLTTVVILQLILSILAWILLAGTFGLLTRNSKLSYVSFSLILLFSLSFEVGLWDYLILSESISISGFIVLLALFSSIFIWENWNWGRSIALIVIGILWGFTRDSNAATLALISISILLAVFFVRSWDRRYLLIGCVYLCVFMISALGANQADRWVGPNLNVLSKRVLTDENHTKFYINQGMPSTDELFDVAEGRSHLWEDGNYRYSNSPALVEFHEWHLLEGKSVYLKFLLKNPLVSFLAPLKNSNKMMDGSGLHAYAPNKYEPLLPSLVNNLLYFRYFNSKSIFALLFLFLISLPTLIWRQEKSLLIPLALIIFAYPQSFAIWHGSAIEMQRHALLPALQLRLSLILIFLVLLEILFSFYLLRIRSSVARYRSWVLIVGIGLIAGSLLVDIARPSSRTFSFGYVQIIGVVTGIMLVTEAVSMRKLVS